MQLSICITIAEILSCMVIDFGHLSELVYLNVFYCILDNQYFTGTNSGLVYERLTSLSIIDPETGRSIVVLLTQTRKNMKPLPFSI